MEPTIVFPWHWAEKLFSAGNPYYCGSLFFVMIVFSAFLISLTIVAYLEGEWKEPWFWGFALFAVCGLFVVIPIFSPAKESMDAAAQKAEHFARKEIEEELERDLNACLEENDPMGALSSRAKKTFHLFVESGLISEKYFCDSPIWEKGGWSCKAYREVSSEIPLGFFLAFFPDNDEAKEDLEILLESPFFLLESEEEGAISTAAQAFNSPKGQLKFEPKIFAKGFVCDLPEEKDFLRALPFCPKEKRQRLMEFYAKEKPSKGVANKLSKVFWLKGDLDSSRRWREFSSKLDGVLSAEVRAPAESQPKQKKPEEEIPCQS